MPVVDSLDELGESIRDWDTADNGRRINHRMRTVGQDFAVEAPLLLPVPCEGFDPGLSPEPRVDRSALITVRMAKCSVPACFIGKRVRVSLRVAEVVVFDGRAAAEALATGGPSPGAARKTGGDVRGTRQLIDVLICTERSAQVT